MHPELQTLLKNRLEIIADHNLRDSNPTAHLEALREVSEKINDYAEIHRSKFDPKMRHYLANHSYQKALDYLTP